MYNYDYNYLQSMDYKDEILSDFSEHVDMISMGYPPLHKALLKFLI